MNNPTTLRNSGWLFSPKVDLLFMWGVIALSFIFLEFYRIEGSKSWELIHYYLIWVGIDVAHIFATFIPLRVRYIKQKLPKNFIPVVLALTILGTISIYGISYQFFITSLAIYAIYHIYAQQHGLLMMTRRLFNETRFRLIDSVMLFVGFWFPVMYWLSDYSPFLARYYHDNDFFFKIPLKIVDFSHQIFLFSFAIYIINYLHVFISKQKINWAKLSLLFATITWMYSSIVWFKNSFMFWACLMIIHGLGYILISLKEEKILLPKEKWFMNTYSKIGILVGMSVFWFYFFRLITNSFDKTHWIVGIAWIHLISHYVFDSMIWRKRFSPY